jgi:hypothetical protein
MTIIDVGKISSLKTDDIYIHIGQKIGYPSCDLNFDKHNFLLNLSTYRSDSPPLSTPTRAAEGGWINWWKKRM